MRVIPRSNSSFASARPSAGAVPRPTRKYFFSGGNSPPSQTQWLTGDRFSVVAHPSLAPADVPMREVINHPPLRHSKVERAWTELAERHGLHLAHARVHDYEQYSLIIDAAMQKLGVAPA